MFPVSETVARMGVAYSIAQLEELAEDAEFVADVREFARELMGTGAVHEHREVMPLLSYSSEYPGVALTLTHLYLHADMSAVPAALQGRLADLAARVELTNTRSPGRPPAGQQITVRLPDSLLAPIDALAEERHTTRAETIRQLLRAAINDA